MSDATAAIRIDIIADGARSGAQQVNAALDSIGSKSRGAASASAEVQSALNGMGGGAAAASEQANRLMSSLAGMKTAGQAANDNIKSLASNAEHASGSIAGMAEHLGKAVLAVAGLTFAIEGVHALIETFTELSDESAEVTSRLLAFTHSSQELAAAQAMVLDVATRTRSGLPEIAELFQKIGIQADHLHLSLGQVGVATTVFAETLKLSGSTTNQQKAAMLQLGEAFDIGQLNGRHFIAMMQDNIVFMRLLAQSMNVPIGALKEMSKEGKVTADALRTALTDPRMVEQIEERFGRLPVTFGQVRVGIRNSLTQLAGDFADGAGLNTSLGVLYAKVAQLGTDLKPTFEKIGVAVRAAFEEMAPAASAALAVIKPAFAFVLDNAPTLIKLVKTATEAWLAYRLAVAGAAAVTLVQPQQAGGVRTPPLL